LLPSRPPGRAPERKTGLALNNMIISALPGRPSPPDARRAPEAPTPPAVAGARSE
jgi:hypothetical protein